MTLPIIWLPGMMCDHRLFAAQIEVLGGEVIVSSKHSTIKDMASEILALAPEEFALVGLSMGGIIAMEVFRQAPERVKKLALLDTNPCSEIPEVSANRLPLMELVNNGHLKTVMESVVLNYHAQEPHSYVTDLCMSMAMNLGAEAFIHQSLALQNRRDQQDTLRSIDIPTLILCGAEDKLCPIERHDLMDSLIKYSKLVVVKEAGHLPCLQQPLLTTEALRCWYHD